MYFLFVREALLCLMLVSCVLTLAKTRSSKPLVLLVSFDGFRWDYLKRTDTPNFDRILKSGVTARKGIKNIFITKTFPNHYSIVTGLYAESHGIVGNVMFDPVFNETFTVQDRDSKWFDNGGEPIWVTNQRQDTTRRSGVMFWPGGSSSVKGILPYKYKLYDEKFPNKSRIDTVVSWFTDDYPVNLGLLYFSEPDEMGHHLGPTAPYISETIKALDGLVGYLLQKLTDAGLINDINIIITSDHGMASTPQDKIINLDNYIDPTSYRIFTSNPVGNILPNPVQKEL
ncbi:hypothetical protein KUTeg_007745 [Tegillarca granosa]|uniref:Ectonucleotide pyrophosphatase/phosphodiesterase family member 5 n=1 Tax=Tegillarca granosa TaxID=220873 RepID=A0ABQ9FH44_TEGGR|nr:hypothetical protein KUTeg_007745 [Tegillarca granosa]